MTDAHKDRFDKWLPIIVALVTNAVLFGVFYGETRIEVQNSKDSIAAVREEMMPMEKRLRVFVGRAEYEADQKSTAQQLSDIKQILRDNVALLEDIRRQQK